MPHDERRPVSTPANTLSDSRTRAASDKITRM
jgi:hypothetical protein